MDRARGIAPAVVVTGTSLMVGCGGGNYAGSCGGYGSYGSYGSGGYCAGQPVASAAGIYEGPLTSAVNPQGVQAVALISESGDGRMSTADGNYYRLAVNPTGQAITGTFIGFSVSATLPNGGNSISGTIVGSITPATFDATFTDTSMGTQTASLNFDNTYNLASSFTTLAGSWQYQNPANGFTISINVSPGGALVGNDTNGCTYSGSFTIIDPAYDLYAEHHVRDCAGATATFDGYAAFFPSTAAGPAGTASQLKVLTDDGAGDYLAADFQ